jgi:hypothetical protein
MFNKTYEKLENLNDESSEVHPTANIRLSSV